jgi:hypothetical protein
MERVLLAVSHCRAVVCCSYRKSPTCQTSQPGHRGRRFCKTSQHREMRQKCREVQISLVELAAPQWPKCARANGVRAAQHLFAADDAHGAGRARADWARGVCRTLAQPAVRIMIALAAHARQQQAWVPAHAPVEMH